MCAWTSVSVQILNDCDATPRRNDAATSVTRWKTEPGNAWKMADSRLRAIIQWRTPKRAAMGGVTADAAKKPMPVASAQMLRSAIAALTSLTVWTVSYT